VLIEDCERLLRAALSHRDDVRFAWLFGSAVARGPDAARDLDVAVAFRSPPSLLDLCRLAADLEREVGKEVDVVDLDGATTLLRWEVLRSGRVLLSPDMPALLQFRARVPLEYFDLRPHLDRQAAGLRRALLGA